MKRIAVVTGSRSEYDRLYSSLLEIQRHPDLELKLIVTGAHLTPTSGMTVREIERDGFPIEEKIETLLDSSTLAGRARSAGFQLSSLVQVFSRINPEVVLVFGDREETICTAIACSYMNIACAHICGGDIAVGNVDDSIRHAVTKLAHLHFPCSEQSAVRIGGMGEEAWRIHMVGDPGLDRLHTESTMTSEDLGNALGVDFTHGTNILLVQHPVSTERRQAKRQMQITLDSLVDMDANIIVGCPNSDAGSRDIVDCINNFAAVHDNITTYEFIERRLFINLLRTVDLLVGNSSMGIFEAPVLHLPTVNIGTRQTDREHSDNILFVGHDSRAIRDAIEKALNDETFRQKVTNCASPFGDGNAGRKIVSVLAETVFDKKLLVKRWAK